LMSSDFTIKNTSWIQGEMPKSKEVELQVRYGMKPVLAELEGNKVHTLEPLRAIAPGQHAVFYKGNEVLGSGIIE